MQIHAMSTVDDTSDKESAIVLSQVQATLINGEDPSTTSNNTHLLQFLLRKRSINPSIPISFLLLKASGLLTSSPTLIMSRTSGYTPKGDC
jgi:hypothetical protein